MTPNQIADATGINRDTVKQRTRTMSSHEPSNLALTPAVVRIWVPEVYEVELIHYEQIPREFGPAIKLTYLNVCEPGRFPFEIVPLKMTQNSRLTQRTLALTGKSYDALRFEPVILGELLGARAWAIVTRTEVDGDRQDRIHALAARREGEAIREAGQRRAEAEGEDGGEESDEARDVV